VIRTEIDIIRHQLARNGVEMIAAEASLKDDHIVHLSSVDGQGARDVTSEHIIIATGTHATEDPGIHFDGQSIFTSDQLLKIADIPKTLAIIGGGVIGLEYASMFAALGVRVTLIDKRRELLSFIDAEIIDVMIHHLREQRVTFRLGEEVDKVERVEDEKGVRVRIHLGSGKQITTERALYSIGRTANTDKLNLEAVKIKSDHRGRLHVNENYQTTVPHIYAVGDVIGFPSLASISMEQGRLAAAHAFGLQTNSVPELFPYGIYAIPEISTVGRGEEELTTAGIPYEIGKAHYREIARGQIIGDRTGLLKIIFHLETHEILGVHIIGEGASELIHIGQAAMAFKGTIDYFINTVFNYPTLAECYKTAAFDGINRLL
jgi:NAD(P) transhydrogenase